MSLMAIKFIGIGALIKLISALLESTDRPELAKVVRIIGVILILVLTFMGTANYFSYLKLLHYHKSIWYLV